MTLSPGEKIYFASDFHFGIPNKEVSRQRELLVCSWLDEIKKDAVKIFLVGDLFDVWFEYKNVVPKGYTRFLGKLAELVDAGISIEAFTGNHDLWMKGYFEEELQIPVHHSGIERTYQGKKFFIAHGDGLGPGDHGYKFLKKILRCPISQWLYRRMHPDTGIAIAKWFSEKGHKHDGPSNLENSIQEDKEYLVQFAKKRLQTDHIDYFIFGHRHLALDLEVGKNSRYINLGDWLSFNTYAVFDGTNLSLKTYMPS